MRICPENWIEEIDEVELIGGWAEVQLRDEFTRLIIGDHYHVFLTPYDPVFAFIQNRTAQGFEIHALAPGRTRPKFRTFCSYRIVARRKPPVDRAE